MWSLWRESGVGAGFGFGVEMGDETVGFCDCVAIVDLTGSGGNVAAGGTKPLGGAGARVVAGSGAGVLGAGVFGSGVFGAGAVATFAFARGVAPGPLTVVDEPAGTDTATPPALVSTVPEIVTMVVSPLGKTDTYESEPARITDAIPVLRTS